MEPVPQIVGDPEPTRVEPVRVDRRRAGRPKGKTVRRPKQARKAAATKTTPLGAHDAQLVRPLRSLSAVVSSTAGTSGGDAASSVYFPLILLGLPGALLLGLAGAAPRLAPHWPGVFVPVIRGRQGVSFFGLSLATVGVLAWALALPGA